MNKLPAKQISVILLMYLQACTSSAENAYLCPEKISATTSVADVPANWEFVAGEPAHFLVSSTFTDGHPSKLGFLRPVEAVKKSGSGEEHIIATYDLSSLVNDNAWLVCQYGNTSATLTKVLPTSLSSCSVTLPRDVSEQTVHCK